jgi:hypothetical protein
LLLVSFGGALRRSELMVFQVSDVKTVKPLMLAAAARSFRNADRLT